MGVFQMKNEEIKKKLDQLLAMYQQLMILHNDQGETFSLENEDLLSKPELLEEALKNYMYQFGLSLYRNKKGNRFFKKFKFVKLINGQKNNDDDDDDENEVRSFDELEPQCFEFEEGRPSFLQRLLEYKPADKLHMLDTIENTFEIIYQKDQQMKEIFDELVQEETQHCIAVINEGNLDAQITQTFEIQNQISTPDLTIDIQTPDISVEDVEKTIEPQPARTTTKRTRTATTKARARKYDCGTNNVKKKEPTTNVSKKIKTSGGNTNER